MSRRALFDNPRTRRREYYRDKLLQTSWPSAQCANALAYAILTALGRPGFGPMNRPFNPGAVYGDPRAIR